MPSSFTSLDLHNPSYTSESNNKTTPVVDTPHQQKPPKTIKSVISSSDSPITTILDTLCQEEPYLSQ